MRPDTALLFPGQGAYTPGMFAGHTDARLSALLSTVDGIAAEFGQGSVAPLLTDAGASSAEDLGRTDRFALQLAVYAGALGGFTLLEQEPAGTVLVGHSMGEVAALVAAGAFDVETGARLLCHRAVALAEHCPEPGGMLSVGLSAERAEGLVRVLDEPGVAIAVRNAPRKVAISGPEAALSTLTAMAEAMGARVVRLSSPYPFHSPMLAYAAQAFAGAVDGVRQRTLRARVWSPVQGRELTDADDLPALLVRQLTAPVDFLGAVRGLHAAGVDAFVEVCHGGLAQIVTQTVPVGTTAAPPVTQIRPAEVPSATPTDVPAPDVVSAVSPVIDRLRALYATALGYPEEAITADADLEADLGIDSLKRAEMVNKVAVHFGLRGSESSELENHSTLSELAGLVEAGQAAAR